MEGGDKIPKKLTTGISHHRIRSNDFFFFAVCTPPGPHSSSAIWIFLINYIFIYLELISLFHVPINLVLKLNNFPKNISC